MSGVRPPRRRPARDASRNLGGRTAHVPLLGWLYDRRDIHLKIRGYFADVWTLRYLRPVKRGEPHGYAHSKAMRGEVRCPRSCSFPFGFMGTAVA